MIRFLYVDDETSLLGITKEFMEITSEFEVDICPSAPEALEALEVGQYRAVVSDYQMPGMDGIEFLKTLKKKGNAIPFILFTGKGREEIAIEALNNGADFYLKKGGDPRSQFAELANMIKHAVTRREAEEAVSHNLRRFRALIEAGTDIIAEVDTKGILIYVSPSVTWIMGYEPEEIIGNSLLSYLHPDDIDRALTSISKVLEVGTGPPIEFRLRTKGGDWRILESHGVRYQNGKLSLIINAHDVTERRQMIERLTNLNRMHAFLSEINQTIVHTRDRELLFQRCCEIAIEIGDFKLASVALLDSETRAGRPVAKAGADARSLSYLDGIHISVDDVPAGRGPFGTALRTNRVALSNDIAKDPNMEPWRERAAKCGFNALVCIPIRLNGKPIGVLALYGVERGIFDEEEVRLLEEITDDISFAVSSIDSEQKREAMEAALRQEEEKAIFILNSITDAIFIHDLEGHILDVNEVACNTLDYSKEEMLKKSIADIDIPEYASIVPQRIQFLQEKGSAVFETAQITRSGKKIPIEVNTRIISYQGKPAVLSVARDITERKKAERQLSSELARATGLYELYTKSSDFSDRELYDFALDLAVKITDSAIGYFHRVSEDEKEILLTTWNGEALKTCTATFESHYPINQAGNWVDCIKLKRPVIYNDFPTSPNQKGLPIGHAPLKRFLSVPVIENGTVKIVFGVGNKVEEYDDRDIVQIQLVANELHKIIKLRRIEDAVRESEQKYRNLTESR